MGCRYSRRDFITRLGLSTVGLVLAPHLLAAEGKPDRLNIILITADDMNFDSLGVTGCRIPGITPNIDTLAREGMRFEQAHVTSAICQPSRSALMTGRYPHRSGAMGFGPINKEVPTLQESLRAAGYFNGIFAKVGHIKPLPKFCWDMAVQAADLDQGRNPELHYKSTKEFIETAKSVGKPFFLMANSEDPHRPYPGSQGEVPGRDGKFPKVSRTFKPDEVPVPGFLPQDVPDIKKEVAQYFGAVHRCDETVGQILRALKESGQEKNTIVFFMSDNGISMPFAKTNCYHASTSTPLIVRWPGKIKAGVVNTDDCVSGVDFMPTVLDVAGIKSVKGMDGRSYLPILKGEKQEGRDKVFTFITENLAKQQFPMRSVRGKRYAYIFNAWSDGMTRFQNESMSGLTFKAMRKAGETDPAIAARVDFFLHRAPEEFYDRKADPNEKNNLIADPKYKLIIDKKRAEMLKMMESTKDPLLEVFKRKINVKRV